MAGKQEGMIKGKTRSGLLYECERIIEHCRPKYLLLENVKNLVGKKFKPQFDEWLDYLESLGYTSYWKVLNAKDYGVPQNRERVFVISILGDHEPYKFADKIPLNKCIADILEDEVDEKYYLSEEVQNRLTTMQAELREPKVLRYERTAYGKSIRKQYEKGEIKEKICNMREMKPREDGISNTITTVQKDNYIIEPIDLPCICASRGRNPENPSSRVAGLPTEQRLEFNTKGTSNTITTVQKDNYVVETSYRIRKLTPRECFRLMGLKDDDIDKIQQVGISNTQQYKMAGNSIVIDVLEAIFRNLFLD